MAKFLRLIGWDKYQHYKDRNPPWVKLYREILTSYTWTVLNDEGRLLAIVCILLASETGNKIPLDRDFIQRRAQLNKRPDVRTLVEVGFAEVFEDQVFTSHASAMLADASKLHTNLVPETETEVKPKKATRAARIPEDFTPNAGHYRLGGDLGVIVDLEFQKFRDHFLGSGATKLDWDATFRNWLRNSLRFGGTNGSNRGSHKTEQHRRWNDNTRAAAAAAGTSLAEIIGHPGTRSQARLGSGSGGVVDGEVKKLP